MLKKSIFFIILILCFIWTVVYGNSMAIDKTIYLPKPRTNGQMSLEQSIQKRRSVRKFSDQDLTWEQIGQLLWAGQGITEVDAGFHFRSAPSAGALYPMEIYALTPRGVFHYMPNGHSLELLQEQDHRDELATAALGQKYITQASVNIVICAVYDRVTRQYGARGITYAHIEAGHIAQNIHLQAVALGLGSVPIGAFQDDAVKQTLNLPEGQAPLYIIPVGYPQ